MKVIHNKDTVIHIREWTIIANINNKYNDLD